jgi:hypothetical protein
MFAKYLQNFHKRLISLHKTTDRQGWLAANRHRVVVL